MRVMAQKRKKPQKNPTHTRSLEKGERRNEKKERECKKNTQTQTIISVQKVKRKSHRRRKTIPLNDQIDEGLGCEERSQRRLREEGEQCEGMGKVMKQ